MTSHQQSDFRGFDSYYYILHRKTLVKSHNTVCWAGLNGSFGSLNNLHSYTDMLKYRDIYIDKYHNLKTIKYIPLLLSIINEITECKEVTQNQEKYIKFKLMSTYDQSLILLNFIRYLWNSPVENYSLTFFQKLKETDSKLDPLERLTLAGKQAAKGLVTSNYFSPGHSNVFGYNVLAIRKTKDLKQFKGIAIRTFLTK